jgi:hypothetical protein
MTILTEAQERALTRLVTGVVTLSGLTGWERLSRQRVFGALCKAGLAQVYVHGGYEITPAGREAHAALIVDVENKAARYLGNANEERQRGHHGRAARWDQLAQRAHDMANELRGQGSGKTR